MLECWNNELKPLVQLFQSNFFLTELSQNPQIILEKQPDVVNPILQHGDSLYTHAEGETRDFLWIVADKTEHLGIDHTGTENFQPARRFANPAGLPFRNRSFAAANQTLDVDLGARFGERKETGPKPHPGILAEDLLQNMSEHSFEIRKSDVPIYHEAFYLMKHR